MCEEQFIRVQIDKFRFRMVQAGGDEFTGGVVFYDGPKTPIDGNKRGGNGVPRRRYTGGRIPNSKRTKTAGHGPGKVHSNKNKDRKPRMKFNRLDYSYACAD